AFGGLGACGSESTNESAVGLPDMSGAGLPQESAMGSRVAEEQLSVLDEDAPDLALSAASTDPAPTQANGQSGTEYDSGGGGDHPACPCGFLTNPRRETVLEVAAHIEGTDGLPIRLGSVRLRVDELLGSTTGLEIGSE